MKPFTEKNHSFIVILNKLDYKCYQLVGMSATKHFKTEISHMTQENQMIGNPIIDIFYDSFRKYGPHSGFIFSPSETKLYFCA
jgi:hypothetical protein